MGSGFQGVGVLGWSYPLRVEGLDFLSLKRTGLRFSG